MCEECYSDENRITPLLNPLDVWRTTLNIFVKLVDGAFVSSMTQIEDCNDGIFLLSHWKLQNYICEQRTIQRKVRVVFMNREQ